MQLPFEHVSATMAGMAFRCMRQLQYRYVEGWKSKPGIALPIGLGLHAGAEANFRQKLITGEDIPVDDVVDAAVTKYRERLHRDGVYLTREEAGSRERILAEAEDQTAALARTMRTEFAPTVQPIWVEQRVELWCDALPVPWLGYVDLVTDKRRLSDIKSANRKWPKGREHREIQPTVYAPMVESVLGWWPDKIGFDLFIKKKEPEHEARDTTRTKADLDALNERVLVHLQMSSAGLYPPCSEIGGGWPCSEKWCGYWWGCKAVPERLKRIANV